MPYSFSYYKEELLQWFKSNIPKHLRILDVGPGVGTYADLLVNENYRIDAVEIFPPYIQKYGLIDKYDNVFIGDICTFDITDYDFIILGDVLEHIPKDDAIKLYSSFIEQGKEMLVAVPFEMEQGEHEGNIYETHHQIDLTPQVIRERYPELKSLKEINDYGYYYYLLNKAENLYVLYANSSYYDTVCQAVKSINNVTDTPVVVYLLNDNRKVPGAETVKWGYKGFDVKQTEYIDRNNSRVYNLLISKTIYH